MIRIEWWRRLFCTGKTQSGKTYRLRILAGSVQNRLIYDLKRQYGSLGVVLRPRSAEEAARMLHGAYGKGCTRVVVQPATTDEEIFEAVNRFVFMYVRNTLFLVDEVQMWTNANYIPYWLKQVICVKEDARIGVWCATQRPQNTHYDVRGNATYYVTFTQKTVNDGRHVERDCGIPREVAVGLPNYCFVVQSDNPEDRGIVRFDASGCIVEVVRRV